MSSKQPPASKQSRSRRSKATEADPIPSESPELTAEARRRRIAIAAFYRAEARGFSPGGEVEDWLEAEREIEALEEGANRIQARQPSSRATETENSGETAARPRKRAASKRSRTARGASVEARNQEDES